MGECKRGARPRGNCCRAADSLKSCLEHLVVWWVLVASPRIFFSPFFFFSCVRDALLDEPEEMADVSAPFFFISGI